MNDDELMQSLAMANPVSEESLPAPDAPGPSRVLAIILDTAGSEASQRSRRGRISRRPRIAAAVAVLVASVAALASPPGQGAVRSALDEIGSWFGGEGAIVSAEGVRPLRANGIITAAVPDGEEGWFVAGGFTEINGEPRAHLAHVRGDGSVDPAWTPSLESPGPPELTWAKLAIANGRLYVAGSFATVNSRHRGQVVALDPRTGELAADWRGVFDSQGEGINAIATDGGRVFVGLTSGAVIAGEVVSCLAALDGATGMLDPRFRPALELVGDLPCVSTIAPAPEALYVGGTFTAADGKSRPGLVALEPETGRLLPGFDPPMLACQGCDVPPTVNALALLPDRLYFGGLFTSLGGQPRRSLAAVDPDTGALEEFAPEVSSTSGTAGAVLNLAVSQGQLYVGGRFTAIASEARNGFAVLSPQGVPEPSWQPSSLIDYVLALAVSGRAVLAAGAVLGG